MLFLVRIRPQIELLVNTSQNRTLECTVRVMCFKLYLWNMNEVKEFERRYQPFYTDIKNLIKLMKTCL